MEGMREGLVMLRIVHGWSDMARESGDTRSRDGRKLGSEQANKLDKSGHGAVHNRILAGGRGRKKVGRAPSPSRDRWAAVVVASSAVEYENGYIMICWELGCLLGVVVRSGSDLLRCCNTKSSTPKPRLLEPSLDVV